MRHEITEDCERCRHLRQRRASKWCRLPAHGEYVEHGRRRCCDFEPASLHDEIVSVMKSNEGVRL